MLVKTNPDVLSTFSGSKLNVTCMDHNNTEIFSFSGPSAKLLKHVFDTNEFNFDAAEIEKILGEKIQKSDVSLLLEFCLDKKLLFKNV
jgi:ethanolamine utilization protein EutA (predicted chaperonin)